ncbi:MAG: polymer-forming cytoskeletal protein [Rickettsiales bacterium]
MFQRTSTSTPVAKVEAPAPKKGGSQPTVIASDVNFMGNIVSEGTLDLDGKIEGNVRCKSLTIRKSGRINGDVFADNVQVFGEVHGLIQAREVQLHNTAHVEGVVMHETLIIEDGAFVDGQLKRIGHANGTSSNILPPVGTDDIDIFKSLKLIPEGKKIPEDA